MKIELSKVIEAMARQDLDGRLGNKRNPVPADSNPNARWLEYKPPGQIIGKIGWYDVRKLVTPMILYIFTSVYLALCR